MVYYNKSEKKAAVIFVLQRPFPTCFIQGLFFQHHTCKLSVTNKILEETYLTKQETFNEEIYILLPPTPEVICFITFFISDVSPSLVMQTPIFCSK